MSFTIEFRKLPLDVIENFGHNYLVLRDDQGRVISQLHGGPSNGAGGLKVFDLKGTLTAIEVRSDSFLYSASHRSETIFEGTKEDAEKLWSVGVQAASEIASKGMVYTPILTIPGVFGLPPLTANSNSVADTLTRAMGLDSPAEFNPQEWADPGSGNIVLNRQEINDIRQSLLLNPINLNDVTVISERNVIYDWIKLDTNGDIDERGVFDIESSFLEIEDWRPDSSHSDTLYNYDGTIKVVIDVDGSSRVMSIQRPTGEDLVGGTIGQILGSTLGKAIGRDSPLLDVAASTLLATVGKNVGGLVERGLRGTLTDYLDGTSPNSAFDGVVAKSVSDLGVQLGNQLQVQVTSVASSFLVGELADALDLQGFERNLFTTAANTVTNQFLNNVADLALNTPGASLFNGFSAGSMALNVANSFGGMFGSYLGTKVVSAKSDEAALFGSAASAVGSYVGATVLSVIPVVGPLLGAFAGQVLGNLVGNAVIDDDRQAAFGLFIDGSSARFGRALQAQADGASLYLADWMALTAANDLNGLLDVLGGSRVTGGLAPVYDPARGPYNQSPVTLGWYMNAQNQKILYATAPGLSQQVFSQEKVAGVVAQAVESTVATLEVSGGNALMERAFNASKAKGLVQLSFDLQVARDYRETYLPNADVINALIAAEPTSEFAAGWIVTLQRAEELGLNAPVWTTLTSDAGDSVERQSVNESLRFERVTDAGAVDAFSKVETHLDAQGRKSLVQTWYDDGRRVDQRWDLAGRQAWASVVEAFGADGFRTSLEYRLDAGGRRTLLTNRPGEGAWREIEEERNGADALLQQRVLRHGGESETRVWDRGQEAWSERVAVRDAQGRLVEERETADNGNLSVTTHDAANTQTWTFIERYYDAAGRLDREHGQYDNGTIWWTDYDQANEWWWERQQRFDTQGLLDQEMTRSDDGSAWYTDYDERNQYDFAWKSGYYVALGVVLVEVAVARRAVIVVRRAVAQAAGRVVRVGLGRPGLVLVAVGPEDLARDPCNIGVAPRIAVVGQAVLGEQVPPWAVLVDVPDVALCSSLVGLVEGVASIVTGEDVLRAPPLRVVAIGVLAPVLVDPAVSVRDVGAEAIGVELGPAVAVVAQRLTADQPSLRIEVFGVGLPGLRRALVGVGCMREDPGLVMIDAAVDVVHDRVAIEHPPVGRRDRVHPRPGVLVVHVVVGAPRRTVVVLPCLGGEPPLGYAWYVNAYDAAGRITRQDGLNDDGNHWANIYANGLLTYTVWDDGGEPEAWQYYTNYYDASGRMVRQTGVADSGATWDYSF